MSVGAVDPINRKKTSKPDERARVPTVTNYHQTMTSAVVCHSGTVARLHQPLIAKLVVNQFYRRRRRRRGRGSASPLYG